MNDFLINWMANAPVTAVPYALAALGLIVSERSGVLNLTAEGLMLIGALAGAGTCLTLGGHPAIALLAAMAAASLVSLLFAGLVVVLRINQVIAGLAVVFFCQGFTGLIGTLAKWQNKQLTGLAPLKLWPLSEIPAVGRILFTQDPIVYLTVLIFIAVSFLLFRTMLGLRIRAVGENPAAADAAGTSVVLHRILAIVAGSSLIGLAGGYISVVSVKLWVTGMTGGRGWIAVALVVFARWAPWPALWGALLFGCIEALIPHVAAAGIRVPQYLMLMTPYLATLAVMIWVGAKDRSGGREPGALGQPHVREERR
ncbi:ABC transporter permease [Bradyrhizobium prioriisuperbiae]|uniref:ABC transporter permease n=1 Tax=Bradyrhizobium prioriisuperbiae TaxID=2854389 RepID=UPI0028F0D220|nr:ABC transporter permease [Bradyrhizobium prioritasuperba]